MHKTSLLLFSLILLGCDSPSNSPIHFSQNIMTIDYHIQIADPMSQLEKQTTQTIIDSTFQTIDQIFNKWNPQSEVSKLNQLKANQTFQLSPQLYQFLQRVDALVKLTDGKFDPTIESIQKLWKHHLALQSEPSIAEIENLQPCIGWNHIHFEDGLFYKDCDGVLLDFGGAAKGLCVDMLIENLKAIGWKNVLVEWGGEFRAIGQYSSERPWRVSICRFEDCRPGQALTTLDLKNEALATSGNYLQTWFLPSGKIYTHIIDPKSLKPVLVTPDAVASGSVMAPDCMTADALATALLLFDNISDAHSWAAKISDKHPEFRFYMWSRKN